MPLRVSSESCASAFARPKSDTHGEPSGRSRRLGVVGIGIKRLSHDTDLPAESEAVGEHAEARRPERLGQRHPHLAAIGKCGEGAVGLGFRRQRDVEREAGEARTFLASVGCHECRSADTEGGVHDIVFKARREHTGRLWFGAILVVHEEVHLRAERGSVEFERLFAAAAEEQIGLDACVHHWCFGVVCRAGLFFLGKVVATPNVGAMATPLAGLNVARRVDV